MATKSEKSTSWFTYASNIAELYNIDLHGPLLYPWPRIAWKQYVSTLVRGYWHDRLIHDARNKSSLVWICTELIQLGKPHPMWQACRGRTHLVEATTTRARLLTSKIILQTHLARYSRTSKFKIDPSCPLCHIEEEDTIHFLTRCHPLDHVRRTKIQDLILLYQSEQLQPPTLDVEICSAILNGACYVSKQNPQSCTIAIKTSAATKAHIIVALLCHQLVTTRNQILNTLD
jgi:hypothetical protein